jgi:hypothetical protein
MYKEAYMVSLFSPSKFSRDSSTSSQKAVDAVWDTESDYVLWDWIT